MKNITFIIYLLLGIFLMQWICPLMKVAWIKITQENKITFHYSENDFFEKIPLSYGEYHKLKLSGIEEYLVGATLYDIHSLHETEGRFYMLALADREETHLNSFQSTLIKKNVPKRHNSHIFFPSWIYAEKEIHWDFVLPLLYFFEFSNLHEESFSPYIAVDTNPPEWTS